MASKYAKILPNLPKMVGSAGDEPGYQDKVNQVKATYAADYPMAQLAIDYVNLRSQEDELNEQLKEIRLRKAAVEQMLLDKMEDNGLDSMRLATGQSVSAQPEPYAQVVDRDALLSWVKANGLERSLTLPWQTVNSLTKERLMNGDSEPDGVTVFNKAKLVLRKA